MGQQETAKQIWDYLTSRGWTKQSVAALLGNMQSESSIIADRWESDIVGNMSGGYGLVQWTPATKYIDWAKSNGLVYQDVISQCKRLEWEVANSQQFYNPNMTFAAFTRSTQSPEELANIFITYYERPLNPNQPARGIQARYWYDLFQNSTGGSGASTWTWPFTKAYTGVIYVDGQQFGNTSYPRGRGYFHDGFDFDASVYGPDILALSDGEVIYTGVMGDGLGSVIVLSIPPYQVMYQEFSQSMSDIFVSTGQKVTKGQRIGRLNGGTHLHLGITYKSWQTALSSWDVDDGSWLNPINIIQEQMTKIIYPKEGEKNMIFAYSVDGQSGTFLFDGVSTIAFAGTNAQAAYNHYVGTYKQIVGKELPNQHKTAQQHALWVQQYPVKYINFK